MEQGAKNEVALIEWVHPRPYTVHVAKSKDSVEDVRLMPGMNALPYSEWSKIENHPVVKKDIEDGEIKVHSVKKGNVNEVLTKMTPRDALALVKATVDREVLRAWAAVEKRSELKMALEKQIGKVTPVVAKSEG